MIPINGETKLFGLLSHGAHFTYSPAMHNFAAARFGKNQVYAHYNLSKDHVESFLDLFWHIGGLGLNITMPHKRTVASLVRSNGLKSVNTLVRDDSGWKGYSTDGEGFLRGLARSQKSIHDFDMIIVIGTGGSAQAITHAISAATTERPPLMCFHRRHRHNDSQILDSLSGGLSHIVTFRDLDPDSFESTLRFSRDSRRLIIQATSAPKNGENFATYASALRYLNHDDLFVDLIYDDPSALFAYCAAHNINHLDGLPMLIEQARLSQLLWWGVAADYDELALAIASCEK